MNENTPKRPKRRPVNAAAPKANKAASIQEQDTVRLPRITDDMLRQPPRRKRIRRGSIRRYLTFACYDAVSSMRAKVSRYRLGWLWWFLNPMISALFFYWVFGVVLRRSSLYPAAYVYIGIIVFSFFKSSFHNSLNTIKANKSIIGRVFVPKVVLVLSDVTTNFLLFLVSTPAVVALILFYRVQPGPALWNVIPMLLLFFYFVLSLSLLCAHIGAFYPGCIHFSGIFIRGMRYMSSVFFSFEDATKGTPYAVLAEINPMNFFVNGIRSCLLYGTAPDWRMGFRIFLISTVIFISGLLLLHKYEDSYYKKVV